MVGIETGQGRVLAFGGETWVWARASDEGRLAHRKFWRQVIFWLAHKEDQGENQVKIELGPPPDRRGQKLEMTVTARDPKGVPIPTSSTRRKSRVEDASGPVGAGPALQSGRRGRGALHRASESRARTR